ncbi:MAG: hypothetical protein H0U21_07615 [Acidimicrobiia bacterium]|nr:hypothetical protein [Acidimicrobiia bacterium]
MDPERSGVGVCYITAMSEDGTDVEALVVRMVMTDDVDTGTTTTKFAVGPDRACETLRQWMTALCTT